MRAFDREKLDAFLFMAPLAVFVLVLILIPVTGTLWDSFFRDLPYMPRAFIGLSNYRALLADQGFRQSLVFTVLFVVVSVPLELLLGLLIALVLNSAFPGRGFLRAAVLIPWAIPAAVSGRIFELVYNYSYGVANYITGLFGFSEPVNWLGTEIGAFFAVVLADAWKTTPFAALILLAGLSAVSRDLNRQAQVDRAHFVQRFFYITLPLIKPVLVVALLFRTIEALRVFDIIFVLTRGGPGGATNAVSLFSYHYFSAGDFGYGAAASVLLFLAALALSMAYVRASRFGEGL